MDSKMNEAMRAQLQKMEGDYDNAEKADDSLNFKVGKQKIYLADYRFDKVKKGPNAGKPILILELKGAEKKNKAAFHDQIFTITTDMDKTGQFNREKLRKFLLGLGIKSYKVSRIDEVLNPLVNQVFEANIDYDKNDYIKLQPLRLIGKKEVEQDADDTEVPF